VKRLGLCVLLVACTPAVPAPEPIVVSAPSVAPAASPPARATAPPPTATRARPTSSPPASRGVGDADIRVLLSSEMSPRVSSPGGLLFTTREGNTLARATRDDVWRVERSGRRVRAVRSDGSPTVWTDGPMYARPMGAALLSLGGKPYRGDLAFHGSDSTVLVVNMLKIDDYLLGVVPLEIGTRQPSDSAAAQAQAVTARSYAYIHLSRDPNRIYDVRAGVSDQVYGGVEVETPVASEAVESTRTLVLLYGGRVVNAPYHSTCGGSTAAASEVWRSNDEPYLQRVSDQIPGTGRFYCDIGARFRWTRTIEGPSLNAAVAQYLSTYTTVPNGRPGVVKRVSVASQTPSGRVGTLTVTTERGNFVVRGNDTRYVLRNPGGEILPSTYFSVDSNTDFDGTLTRLTIRGNGNGHGVGMCQWGAIGRARSGQDFRTILRTYYPGTTVGPAH
jgi:stage II sporulation protein D